MNCLIYTNPDCNLHCPRCFLRRRSIPIMPIKNIHHIVEYLKVRNILFNKLAFVGGETTNWEFLMPAIKLVRPITKCVQVVSNGINKNIEDYGDADLEPIRITRHNGT